MRVVFADSFYFFALVNPNDPKHSEAEQFARGFRETLVTTSAVLLEVGDGLAHPRGRPAFLKIVDALRRAANVRIVDCDARLLEQGVDLYRSRMDKSWSLTDCASFIVMEREKLSEALTGDRHFEQAGFAALFR